MHPPLLPGKKFSTAPALEKHVEMEHTKKKSAPKVSKDITEEIIDEVADEFASEVANMEAKNNNKNKAKKQRTMPDRNWQECPDRNWAAEFGYGGSAKNFGVTKDILSKMALTFKSQVTMVVMLF